MEASPGAGDLDARSRDYACASPRMVSSKRTIAKVSRSQYCVEIAEDLFAGGVVEVPGDHL